jgi:histidyl-tRNA synthetase
MNEILDNEGIKQKESVLREIDKYDKLGEKQAIKNLKKYKAEKVLGILKQNPEFFRKYKSFSEIEELIKYCKIYGVDVLFSPTVVRGLSYYNGNVFEIKITGIKETLAAGGSYLCGETQATGISFGLERLMLVSKIKSEDEKTLIISLNQDKKAIEIAQKLRKKNHVASIYYGKPSKALEYADSYNFQKVIFVGSKEIKAKKFKIKDMKTGKESLLKI